MYLDIWAKKWNINMQALSELKHTLGITAQSRSSALQTSEAGIQSAIRQEASQIGARLWRNNVGATYTSDGAFIRFGLANDSTHINKTIKSADLIGIKPVKITTSHVGFTIGQFVSREVKASHWKFTGNERELAQLKWAELILALGGDAAFATGLGTL